MRGVCRTAGTVCFPCGRGAAVRGHRCVAKDWESCGAEKHRDAGVLCGDIRLSHVESGSVDAERALVDWFLAGAMRVQGLRLRSHFLDRGVKGVATN